MGASVSSRSQGGIDKSLSTIDVVVVDTAAAENDANEAVVKSPINVVKDADSRHIPIVNALWIIQSVINGRRLPTNDFLLKKWFAESSLPFPFESLK